jgi:DNA-binding MarR family transcriptional regulator
VSHHEEQIRRLLDDIAGGGALSQRALAQKLGIALGLTNQLLRMLADRGFVTTVRALGRRVRYVLTQAGTEEHARMSRNHLIQALTSYAEARDRIRRRLTEIAGRQTDRDRPRVVFYGLGQAAEIGMACAAEAGLRLVGVVDDAPGEDGVILGVPVRSPVDLTPTSLGGEPFDWILVTELSRTEDIRRQLQALGLGNDRVCWL